MKFKANSCHDCLRYDFCDNPEKNPDGGYRCHLHEWEYE